jgi:hypothetical protein
MEREGAAAWNMMDVWAARKQGSKMEWALGLNGASVGRSAIFIQEPEPGCLSPTGLLVVRGALFVARCFSVWCVGAVASWSLVAMLVAGRMVVSMSLRELCLFA